MAVDVASADLASVDLTDLDLWADGPPYALFARMRSEAPVLWNPSADGVGFWSLTRASDIRQVNQDPETFSSARDGIFLRPDALAPLEFARNFPIYKDPPEHDLYRSIVARAFSPRAMELLDQDVRRIVIGALEKIRARGDTGKCDLVRDLAVPVPVTVIGRMMGSVDADIDKLLTWTQTIQDGMTYARDATATFMQMAEYYMGLVNSSHILGVTNLVRSIRLAEIDGRKLNDEEIAVYLGMLLYAGNQPTRDAISAGLEVLIQHPDQMELLRQHPDLLKPLRSGAPPSPLVEILRWTSPACYFARTATKNTTIGGVRIKTGDRVAMWYASANRDPEVIPDPDTFDITRDANSVTHFSFGGGGPHHCQGDFLAHKTIYLTMHEAIKQLGDLEMVGPVTRVSSTFASSLTSLPVRFKPATDPRPVAAQLRPGASPLPRPSGPAPHATRARHQPSPDRAGWWARA
jgi:cytochrome P450